MVTKRHRETGPESPEESREKNAGTTAPGDVVTIASEAIQQNRRERTVKKQGDGSCGERGGDRKISQKTTLIRDFKRTREGKSTNVPSRDEENNGGNKRKNNCAKNVQTQRRGEGDTVVTLPE